jgi:uncharacterized protein involved in outer membrane biogenesis
MSLLRKLFWAAAALVVVTVVAAAVFVYTFDANQHRGTILAQLSATLARPVEAKQLELKLFPLELKLNHVRVLEAPDSPFASGEFVRAEAMRFDLSLLSLLRGRPRVLALELDKPTISLRQDAHGRWNFASVGVAPSAPGEPPPAAPAAPPAEAPLRDWRLRDGTLVVERPGQPPLRLTGVEMSLRNINWTKPFPFHVAVNFSPESRVEAAGELGPLNLGDPTKTPLGAELKLAKFHPDSLASLVEIPAPLEALGALEGALRVQSSSEGVRVTGPVSLLGKSAGDAVGVTLDASFPADFSRVELRDTALEFQGAQLTASGRAELDGGSFDLAVATPQTGGDLAALRALSGRLGWPLPVTIPPVTGRLVADVTVRGAPTVWQLAGRAGLRDATFLLEGLKQPLRLAVLDVTLSPERIEAAPFTLSLAPGVDLKVSAAVDDYRRAARLAARVTGANVPLESLLALAAGFGVSALGPNQRATGFVDPELEIAGPLASLAALSYRGRLRVREAALELLELPAPLRISSAAFTFDQKQIAAEPFTASLGPGVAFTVAGTVSDYTGAARLQARVTGQDIPVAPLLALAKVFFGADPLGEGRTLAGRVSPALDLSGSLAELSKLSYQGTLGVRDLVLTTPPLAEPIRSPALDLAISPTRLSAEPFAAQIGDKLRGRVSFRLENYRAQPALTARVSTEAAELEALVALARAFGSDPLPGGSATGRVTATLDVSGSLAEKAAPLAVSAQAQLNSATVKLPQLTGPLSIELASLEFTPARMAVTNLRLAAAGSRVAGSVRVENFAAPAVDFSFRGDTLDLEALQALFGAEPSAPARAPAKTRRVSELLPLPVVHAQGAAPDWFAKLTARGRVDFERVRHGTLTLAPFGAPVAIAKQVVTCDPVEFGFYDGGGRGRLVVDLHGEEPATDFSGLLRNVDANKLLSENSDSKDRLYGRLGGTLQVRFTGSERDRITQSARGKGQMSLAQGRLARLNLSRELGVLVQVTGLRYNERDTPIEDLTTNFEIADGWVRTEDLTVKTPEQTLTAVGGFSLAGELAFAATSTFTPEASQRMTSGGPLGGITGAITGALFTDEQGRVVVPFNLRGTLAEPKFQLDAARLAEMRRRRSPLRPSGTLKDILEQLRKRP